jgi:hypothetical protein
MGFGRAVLVVGSYDMPVKEIHPTRRRYLMKKGFAMFYWRTLTGSLDWLFAMYFGKTQTVEKVQGVMSEFYLRNGVYSISWEVC